MRPVTIICGNDLDGRSQVGPARAVEVPAWQLPEVVGVLGPSDELDADVAHAPPLSDAPPHHQIGQSW